MTYELSSEYPCDSGSVRFVSTAVFAIVSNLLYFQPASVYLSFHYTSLHNIVRLRWRLARHVDSSWDMLVSENTVVKRIHLLLMFVSHN